MARVSFQDELEYYEEDEEEEYDENLEDEKPMKYDHITKRSVQINVDLVEKDPRVNKIPYTDFELGAFLGRGSFGVVFHAKWNGINVAVKSVGSRSGRGVPKEVVLLSKVQHPNIIDFYGYSESNSHIFLVMEYADCGSLYDIIHRYHPQYGAVEYSPAHVLNWSLQCAEAMDYLHTRRPKIIHRDLKPSNVLLSRDCEVVKICDFGEARTIQTEMTAGSGTPLWMAPEVINGTNYTEKCDVYSFGIVLWEMIYRKKPFHDLEVEGQGIFLAVYKGLRPTPLDDIPWSLRNLITSCWDEYPKDRPSFGELIKFLRLAFNFVHEGDERFFTIVDINQKDFWDNWSESVIILKREHSIEHENVEQYTEDTSKVATKPLIKRPLSVDEFRKLLKKDKHPVKTSQKRSPTFSEIVESNKSLLIFLGTTFSLFTIHCIRYR